MKGVLGTGEYSGKKCSRKKSKSIEEMGRTTVRAVDLGYIIINRVCWVVNTVNSDEELGFWTV